MLTLGWQRNEREVGNSLIDFSEEAEQAINTMNAIMTTENYKNLEENSGSAQYLKEVINALKHYNNEANKSLAPTRQIIDALGTCGEELSKIKPPSRSKAMVNTDVKGATISESVSKMATFLNDQELLRRLRSR